MKKDSTAKWLFEANEEAEAYKDLPERVKGLETAFYAFIKHHAEDEDEKGEHFHGVLVFKKPKTFEEVQEALKGAHIEQLADFDAHIAYLTHQTPQAKADGKKPYSIDEITTSDKEKVKRATLNGSKEALDPNHILDDIRDGCTTLTAFVMRYKPESVKPWTGLIKDLIKEREPAREEAQRAIALGGLKELYRLACFDQRANKYDILQQGVFDLWEKVNNTR